MIVLSESLRNCKRRNKGKFTSKYNSKKIMLCGGWGQQYLVLQFLSELNNIFHVKGLNIFTLNDKLRKKTKQEKY